MVMDIYNMAGKHCSLKIQPMSCLQGLKFLRIIYDFPGTKSGHRKGAQSLNIFTQKNDWY